MMKRIIKNHPVEIIALSVITLAVLILIKMDTNFIKNCTSKGYSKTYCEKVKGGY